MTELMLAIFLLMVFYNIAFSIFISVLNKPEEGYFFIYHHNKNPNRYVVVSCIIVAIIFVFGLIVSRISPIISFVVIFLIDVVFGYLLYLDYNKKLKDKLIKFKLFS